MDLIASWHELSENMFDLQNISVLEKALRPLIVYVFLIVGLCFAGIRELSQMNPLDLIVLLMLSNTAQNAVIGQDNSVTGGLIGVAALFGINHLLVRLTFVSSRIDRLINGDPITLIQDGELRRTSLDKLMIRPEELHAVVRAQGVRRLEDVETATLETSGTISIIGHHPPIEFLYLKRLDERLARIEDALKIPHPAEQIGQTRASNENPGQGAGSAS